MLMTSFEFSSKIENKVILYALLSLQFIYISVNFSIWCTGQKFNANFKYEGQNETDKSSTLSSTKLDKHSFFIIMVFKNFSQRLIFGSQ